MGSPSDSERAPENGRAGESGETGAESVTEAPRDLVFVQGQTEQGLAIVRLKTEVPGAPTLEVAELRPIRQGQPIHGEVLKLLPRPEDPRLFEAEVVVPSHSTAAAASATTTSMSALPHKGPARVTTEAFRANWEGIFGGRSPSGAAN